MKTVPVDQFRTQGRGGKGVRGGNLRDEDYVEHLLTTTAHSYLLFFSNRGRVYRLRAHEIPMKDRTARGTALVNLVALQPDEHIEAIIDTRTYEDGAYLFFATRNGIVKKTRMSEYDSSLRSGLIAINLNDGDELVRVIQTIGHRRHLHGVAQRHDDPLLRRRRAPDGPGRRPACAGMRLKNDRRRRRELRRRPRRRACCCSCRRAVTASARRSRRSTARAAAARACAACGSPSHAGRWSRRSPSTPGDEILVFSSAGNIVRMGVDEISEQGRDATGVRVARLDEGDTVVAVAPRARGRARATRRRPTGECRATSEEN